MFAPFENARGGHAALAFRLEDLDKVDLPVSAGDGEAVPAGGDDLPGRPALGAGLEGPPSVDLKPPAPEKSEGPGPFRQGPDLPVDGVRALGPVDPAVLLLDLGRQ